MLIGCVASIGKKTYRGTIVQGTDEALAKELREVFQMIDGVEGQKMRGRVKEVKGEIEKDLMEGGKTWKALRELASLWNS